MTSSGERRTCIHVLVVDDEALARSNLTVLLRKDPDVGSIVEAASGQEAPEPPIEDLRLGFYAVDATQPHAVAEEPLLEETDRGNQAVLGRKEQCFKPTEDQRDVWLVIIAEAGRGVAAAQIFQKDR